ncbi:restriction endonuclease subunit S [Lactococcus lactis]|uniref:restriction endonuclease subunit S n=1 Tax=Lactococcus lactis TaxID=1358 RepID=UPI0012E7202B|nr:restriction endonuclease subunit S [Lactococcus lactis]MUV47919.1 restriction endonuclease subunit S [Lactococcus lactis]
MKERLKAPELRFDSFTDDWEERKLGEIFNYEQPTKYIVKSTEYDDTFNTPVLTAGKSFLLGYTDEITGIKNATVENPVVIFDDFTTGSHYVDFPFKIKSSAMKLLSLNDNSDNFYFMFNALKNIKYVPQSHERHWISKFSSFEIYKPSQEEQQKIGSFFKQLDSTIALHQRKIDLLKEQKKGYLQKMFPKNGAKVPELRFEGFADDWEERKLIDLATTYIGLVTTMTENYTNKGTLLIRNSDIKEGRFDLSNPIYLEEQFAEENKTRRMRKGDVVTVHTGDIGTSAMINSELDGAIGFATITTRPTKELDSNFLAWYFNSNYHKKYAKRMSTGDGRSNYNMKDFNKNVIPTPQIDEQQKIGAFFKQLDDTIALHQRKLDLLKEQKKGFLQKMFV